MFAKGGPVTDYKNCVGPGWHPLLDQLHAELAEVDPGYQTLQVKEKFGDLRVYIISTREDNVAHDIIYRYEGMSSKICENCGQPGSIDTSFYWRKTLCDQCKQERKR